MATVIADMTMSLDGFIADPSDGIIPFDTGCSNVGALIAGRRLFDVAKGWGGHPSIGRPGLRGHPQRPRRLARTPRPIE
jgi:hypothetical protein